MGKANGKVAQLTAKEKSIRLGLTADPKGSSGAARQEGRKFRDVGQYMAVGKQWPLQPMGLSTGHPGT